MNRLFVAAVAAAVTAVPAGAATITFNNAGNIGQVLGNTVVENGFQVKADVCPGGNCFTVRAAPTAGTGSDGKVLEAYAFSPKMTVSQVNGGTFTLQSFAVTGVELSAAFLTNFDVLFGFNYADGTSVLSAGSIDANFSTPTSYVIQAQNIGYTGQALKSFFIQTDFESQATAKLQLDNINVTPVAAAVPEPATWAMMIGGFGAVGASLRRRRRVAVRFA